MSSYKKTLLLLFFVSGFFFPDTIFSQNFAPQVGVNGSTAIYKDSSIFVGWATSCYVHRGYINISDTTQTYNGSNKASFGADSLAIGYPKGIMDVVSLGDKGFAILSFDKPIKNGKGFDFAVFENGILQQSNANMAFLELAFVEVSSDSIHFFRFPATSQTNTSTQISSFDYLNAKNIHNLAGKYIANYGTPFDLSEIKATSPFLDLNNIKYIKIIDVCGSISPAFASFDDNGNIINDPFPTPFNSCGFDLDAIGVIHENNKKAPSDIKIQVFPNPATNNIHIKSDTNFIKNIKIYNICGEKIHIEDYNSKYIDINVSNYKKGIYILIITTDSNVLCKKIIIDK